MSTSCVWKPALKSPGFLSGSGAEKYSLVNQYLGYLADRNYSPRTLRAYGYDLLAFCRWLESVNIDLGSVTTETVLDFMRYCRQTPIAGRPANVVSMAGKDAKPIYGNHSSWMNE